MKAKHKSILFAIIATSVGLSISYAIGLNGQRFESLSLAFACGLLAFAVNWIAFVPANALKTERFYDLVGSITYLSVIAFAVINTAELDTRAQIAAVMVAVWAIRLGSFLVIRIHKDGGDGRFDEIKNTPARFFTAWTIQGLWVVLTAACALAIITGASSKPIGVVGGLGILIWIIGFIIEVVADAQKRAFRRDPANAGRYITSGLWAWSRHPNYFGEITLWTGMAILALPVLSGSQYVALISPVFVILLLTRISGIPMLQEAGKKRWGDEKEYLVYLNNTSLLIPMPPKK